MWAFLSIFILSTAGFADDFDSLMKQARAASLAFDLDTAQAVFAQACPADQLAAFPLQKASLCQHEFGTIAEAKGNGDEAADHYLKALAGWEKLGRPYLTHQITTMTNLGGLYRREHRSTEAEKMLNRALELATSISGSDPELYATVLSRSAALYRDLDQPERARGMLEDAITRLRALNPINTSELAWAYSALGMVNLGQGQYKSGESSLRKALGFSEENLGEENPETAAYATNLALALLVQGQYNGAETLLRRARFVIESRVGPDSVELVSVLAELTSVEKGLGKFQVAEDCAEKALAILDKHVPAESIEIVLTQVNLGSLYLRERKTAEAEKILPTAVEEERRMLKDGRTLGDGIRNLAALKAQQKSWGVAESLYREAISIYERRLGVDHPDIAPVLREYADVLKHNRVSKARIRSVEARALAIENPAQHRHAIGEAS
ncbi:MAG TPA: tetratricopeptide repeat protein [Bryobacteraceae bacterium]|jgi:tetratricopeptide (TPR) repeat protein|nr:tetratricopeptide repeat protein [Bryobacteraceae bacterium]